MITISISRKHEATFTVYLMDGRAFQGKTDADTLALMEKAVLQNNSADDDPQYQEAVAYIREKDAVSISLLQEKFGIDFVTANQMINRMEHEGIVSPAVGATPRAIFK